MKHLWFEHGAYASRKAKQYLTSEFFPSNIKSIAVIRHAALGDQVIVRPFLIEARKLFPNAKITLVGVSNYQYGMPIDLVDRVVLMHGKERKADISLKDKINNIKELGEQDLIFDLAGTSRSHWMVALTKAKLKVGFPYKSVLRRLLYDVAIFRTDFSAEVELMLDMLRIFGHNPNVRLDFGYPDHKLHYQKSNQSRIVYFNGASTTKKIISKEQLFNLIEDAISRFPNQNHVFLEGVGEHEKGDFLKGLTNHSNFEIQSVMELDVITEYLASSALVVSPDTGIRNLAISTHTPTVGLFFSTVPFRYTPRYEPYHSIVMNPNGEVPSNHQILESIEKTLKIKSMENE